MQRAIFMIVILWTATLITSSSANDIFGDTHGLGPEMLQSNGSPRSSAIDIDSMGQLLMLDSATGVITAEGVQSYIEGARGQTAYLVAWHDNRRSLANDIFAARLSFDGKVLDSINIIVSGRSTEESYPAVAFDGTNWLVVWSDLREGVADIYGARVAQDGSVLDSLGFVISNALYTQTLPAVAFNGTNYLVVWTDYRASTYKTYCARVTPAGQVLDPGGILLSVGGCLYPAVVSNGSDWLATWHDEPNRLIMAGRIGPDGTVRDPGGFIIGSGNNDRFFPDAAFDGTNYFVVWQDRRQGTAIANWSIYGARINAEGVALDTTGRPVANNDSKYEGIPQVWFGDTAYFVSWKDDGNNMLTGARVARDGTVIDPSGIPLGGMPQWFADIDFDGTNWLVMSTGNRESGGMGGGEDACATRVTTAGVVLDPYPNVQLALSAHWQHRPVAAFDGERWLAVWMEQKTLGENDIRGILLNAQGQIIGDAFTICNATGYQSLPAVCAGDSGWLVAWQDYRAGQLDKLYATRVTRSGTVLDPNGIGVAISSSVNRYPAIAFDGINWMVVFWTWVSPNYHIFGARISQAGTVLDPNGFDIVQAVYGIGWNNHISLGLAFDGTNYLMVWPDFRNNAYDIYGSRITPSGNVLEPGGLPVCLASGDQDFVHLAYGSNRWLAIWHDTRGSSSVYATLVDTSGQSLDTSGFLVSSASSDALNPAIAFTGTNFLVAWTDMGGSDPDVYAARVSPTGTVLDPQGIPIADTKQAENYPAVAGGELNQVLVLVHSYAPAPWQCTRIWGGLFSHPAGIENEKTVSTIGEGVLHISSNPTPGKVIIQLSRAASGDSRLGLYDAAGRLKHRIALTQGNAIEVDLSDEPTGVYFIRFESEKIIRKIIITK